MFTPEEIEMAAASVVCRTSDCPNADEVMVTPVAANPSDCTVRCGWCGVEITDINRA